MSSRLLESPVEIRQLLQRALTEEAETWIEPIEVLPEVRTSARLIAFEPPRAPEFLVFSSQELESLPEAGECRALLTLKGKRLLGARGAFSRDERALRLSWPPRLVEIQRRESLRYAIPPGYEITAVLDNPEGRPGAPHRVVKQLQDLAPNGLSFAVLSGREAGLYSRGRLFKGCELRIRGERLPFDAEVRSRRQLTRPDGSVAHAIGLKITRMHPDHSRFLEQLVANALIQKML
jgi:hypothetical protein